MTSIHSESAEESGAGELSCFGVALILSKQLEK
jgi:hypothetical protein